MFVWWIVHCYRVILWLPDCVWCIFIVFLPFSRRMLRAVQWERHLLKLPHSTHKQMMKTGQRALGTTCFSTIQKVNAEAFTRVIFKSFSIFPFFHIVFFLSFWPVVWAIICYSLDHILHHKQSKRLQIIWFVYADFFFYMLLLHLLFMLFKVWQEQIHHDICLCFSEPIRSEGASQDRNVSHRLWFILLSFTLPFMIITVDCCCFTGHYHAERRKRRSRSTRTAWTTRTTSSHQSTWNTFESRRTRAPGPTGAGWTSRSTRTRRPDGE